jgi:hypothetical protein
MIKYIVICLCGLFLCVQAFATPPTDLSLSYDLDAGTITAQGHHPTQDRFKHYIRRMVVTQEGQEPKTFYFTRQDSASEFKQIVSVKLKAGDKAHVQVYCSQGGSSEADLVVPAEQKTDLNAIKARDHKNSLIMP